MTTLPSSIFKAYDVRGLYGSDIDGDGAELLGRAFTRVIAQLEDKPRWPSFASASAVTCGSRHPSSRRGIATA